ncbi:MAG: c-type cytochrome [Phycisphaerales bacterium]|nr:c-type cytochrome [Phycisphaerales bacterium]
MSGPSDILLPRPIPTDVIQLLRFAAFTLHMLFVLVTLGTGILSIAYFFQIWWMGKRNELRWDREILRTFVGHKSLAVVLGVGPLLLIQVGHPVAFFSAVNLFAPAWLLILGLLITAFLCMDYVGQRLKVRHGMHLLLGMTGLVALLAVPGIFVAVLIGVENPDRWSEIAGAGHRLPLDLGFHWMARYLHVLGASVVVAGIFQYFWSQPWETHKRRSLLAWIIGGTLVQIALGVMLFASMPRRGDAPFNIAVFTGTLGACWLVAVLIHALRRDRPLRLAGTVAPVAVLLFAMLLARQLNQDRTLVPFARAADRRAELLRSELDPFRQEALATFAAGADRVLDGPTLYATSCAFCHGSSADGTAPDAQRLAVPPENLAAMRTTRSHLRDALLQGVPGTAMPRFGYYTRAQLDLIIDDLDRRFDVLGPTPPMPHEVTPADAAEARRVFGTVCAVCHAPDGSPTAFASAFAPPPPDLRLQSLAPDRAFEVITHGYPGTEMPAFRRLPEGVRWGLVRIVLDLRAPVDERP